jgi:ring-1,2-phenylacetyl-CoA epoxidase subunit PaaD
MNRAAPPSRRELLEILDEVKDPEVPVLSVVELGIVRDVRADKESGGAEVVITPTYSGCPAMFEIERDIRAALEAHGVHPVSVRTVYSPAWTTDWIGPEARAKLRGYGIAPPGPRSESATELVTIGRRIIAVQCPVCQSRDTRRQSEFGSTACKAIWICDACGQPFEEFKAF